MIAEMEIIVGWAAIFIGLAGASFLLGRKFAMCGRSIREHRCKNLDLYQKWGLCQELSDEPLLPGKAVMICVSIVALFAFLNFVPVVSLVCKVGLIAATWSILCAVKPYWMNVIIILFLFFGSAGCGFYIRKRQFGDLKTKMEALKDFSKSHFKYSLVKYPLADRAVGLAMYEALRTAPGCWEAYVKLNNANPDAATDREFRELAATYHHSRTNQHTRLAILISLVGVAASLGISVGIPLLKALHDLG